MGKDKDELKLSDSSEFVTISVKHKEVTGEQLTLEERALSLLDDGCGCCGCSAVILLMVVAAIALIIRSC